MSEITVGTTYKLKGPKGKPPIEAVVTAVKPRGRGHTVENLIGKKKLNCSMGKFQSLLVQ